MVSLAFLVIGMVVAASAHAQPFVLGCPAAPYQAIASPHAIDESCPAEGTPSSPALAAEYRAKNNLCATGTPTPLTLADFLQLQTIAEGLPIPLGDRSRAVDDRSVLQHLYRSGDQLIGEGDVVRLMAYIVEARPTGETPHADGTCGEGVNCRQCGAEQNDIHIALADRASKAACAGIVAEMIPHLRPTAWTPAHLQQTMGRLVRITGQLFFDSRHHTRPCHDTQHPADPPRVSLWEIHPVYAVEVCTAQDPADCQDTDAAVWKPLDAWGRP
jgi:hypothetical protein